MSTAVELLRADANARLSRMLLRAAADDAPVQDLIDCAALAQAIGEDDVAARLSGLAALELGAGPIGQGGFSIDLAIDELHAMMAIAPRLTEHIRFPPAGTGPNQRPSSEPSAVTAVTSRSDALLAAVPNLLAEGGLAAGLRTLANDLLSLPRIPPDEHVAADPATLASLLGLHRLRRFVTANAALLCAERDGPPLFEASARLRPAALGPYFSNVRLLIRDARDIFAMIDAAAADRAGRDAVETWCVLLSTHLHNHQLVDLVDELGDRGMTRALAHLLARAAATDGPHHPADVVWRIRDVCLDIREWELAADAQQVIALWRPHDVNEWGILADIRTVLNDPVGAEGALDRAILLRPDDANTLARVARRKAGTPPLIDGGYSTPPGRRRLRRARCDAYRAQG